MKYTEIIKLLDAGYSRDEILQMSNEEPDPSAEPEPAADPEPAAEPGNTNTVEVAEGVFNDLKELFSDMKKEFTAFNIMASRQNTEERTGDDVIANIINPFERGGNNNGRS